MATFDKVVNVTSKRIMGIQDFRERLVDYTKKLVRDIHDVAFGLDGVFGGVPIVMTGFGANKFQLGTDPTCSDGSGHFLKTDMLLAGRDIGISFENSVGIAYTVGLHYDERQRSIQVNPRTGFPEWLTNEEFIGNRAEPNSVVDNGDGTITFRVDSAANPFGHARTHAGRRCLVWKKTPGRLAVTEALASQTVLVTFSAGQNFATTTTVGLGGAGLLGQSNGAVSTNPSDYYVMVLGPTVTRQSERDLEIEPGYTMIGHITGNGGTPATFDIIGQNDLSSGFAVDLNAITRLDVHGDLKIRVRADTFDVDEKQIEVQEAGGATTFQVDEDGDITTTGTLNVTGLSTLTALTATGNVNLGDADADVHVMKGGFTHRNTGGTVKYERDGATGETAVGGVRVVGKQLKTYGTLELGNLITDLLEIVGVYRQRQTPAGSIVSEFLANGRGAVGGAQTDPYAWKVYGQEQVLESQHIGATLAAGAEALGRTRRYEGDLNTLSTGGWNFWELINGLASGSVKLRRFVSRLDDGVAWTINANYDGTNWVKDTGAGRCAMRLKMFVPNGAGGGFEIHHNISGADDTFPEANWSPLFRIDAGSARKILMEGTGGLDITRAVLQLRDDLLTGTSALRSTNVNAPYRQNGGSASATYTELWTSAFLGGTGPSMRIYAVMGAAGARRGFVATFNARHNGAVSPNPPWSMDVTTQSALMLHIDPTPNASPNTEAWLRLLRKAPTASAFAEADWIQAHQLAPAVESGGEQGAHHSINDGRLIFPNPTAGSFGTNPLTIQVLRNTLAAKNIVKNYGNLNLIASGGTIVVQSAEGFAISSAAIVGSAPNRNLRINFSGASITSFTDAPLFWLAGVGFADAFVNECKTIEIGGVGADFIEIFIRRGGSDTVAPRRVDMGLGDGTANALSSAVISFIQMGEQA